MLLLRYKQTKTSVLGVLKGDNGDTYYTCENAETRFLAVSTTWGERRAYN